jgi:hypothetical protein
MLDSSLDKNAENYVLRLDRHGGFQAQYKLNAGRPTDLPRNDGVGSYEFAWKSKGAPDVKHCSFQLNKTAQTTVFGIPSDFDCHQARIFRGSTCTMQPAPKGTQPEGTWIMSEKEQPYTYDWCSGCEGCTSGGRGT